MRLLLARPKIESPKLMMGPLVMLLPILGLMVSSRLLTKANVKPMTNVAVAGVSPTKRPEEAPQKRNRRARACEDGEIPMTTMIAFDLRFRKCCLLLLPTSVTMRRARRVGRLLFL